MDNIDLEVLLCNWKKRMGDNVSGSIMIDLSGSSRYKMQLYTLNTWGGVGSAYRLETNNVDEIITKLMEK